MNKPLKIPKITEMGAGHRKNESSWYLMMGILLLPLCGLGARLQSPIVSSVAINPQTNLAVGYAHLIVKVASGNACALFPDGTVKCWGDNVWGQLGINNVYVADSEVPVPLQGISNATDITIAYDSVCATLVNGTIKCFGSENSGIDAQVIAGVTNAVSLSIGNGYSCALLSNGTVQCWGYNNYGQLGNGTTSEGNATNFNFPGNVYGITAATMLSAGMYHTCAILSDRTVTCWGHNEGPVPSNSKLALPAPGGQLGNGTNDNSNIPVKVTGITNAISITAGAYHSCALLFDHTVKCWGNNEWGQLGDGTYNASNIPVTVKGISNVTGIAAGDYHNCAVLSDHTVKCWGSDFMGQLGDGNNSGSSVLPAPVEVNGINNAISISAGTSNSCAVLADNTVKCWGEDNRGQLGSLGGQPLMWKFKSDPVTITGL